MQNKSGERTACDALQCNQSRCWKNYNSNEKNKNFKLTYGIEARNCMCVCACALWIQAKTRSMENWEEIYLLRYGHNIHQKLAIKIFLSVIHILKRFILVHSYEFQSYHTYIPPPFWCHCHQQLFQSNALGLCDHKRNLKKKIEYRTTTKSLIKTKTKKNLLSNIFSQVLQFWCPKQYYLYWYGVS